MRQDLLNALREYAFRASFDNAKARSFTREEAALEEELGSRQTLHFNGTEERTVYSTDWAAGAAAASISLVGLLAVLTLYHRWWTLGRRVSLNPLEFAKAFRAPLLDGANSNADRSQLAAQAGHVRVKYGAAAVGVGKVDVEPALEDINSNRSPKLMLCFSESSHNTDDALRVLSPKRNMTFV